MTLFPDSAKVGVFRGFREGGLEFHADIALPYHGEMHHRPMHGSFILVRLENEDEAVLGRITSFSSEGRLASSQGEDFSIRAVQENRDVSEDLREQYLKYRVNIRVLGVLRKEGNRVTFVPSHRRLPHVGSPVAFPTDAVVREIAGHNSDGVTIGHLALGEYVYDPERNRTPEEMWMQLVPPCVEIKFDIKNLISRRSFIFARAGFGKSNLNKLLFSQLYKEQPHAEKRGGRLVPVGTIIFDPDGEYFWPDDRGRPGLCDVPWLEDKLVVFTSRIAPSAFYGAFTASQVRLDIRELRPSDVISISLPPDKQEQQNVAKLRSLSPDRWRQLVDLIYQDGNGADLHTIGNILNLTLPNQEAEAVAARSNTTTVVRLLHDPSSQLMTRLLEALEKGKLCVVDLSQMRGTQGYILAGIILRQIFSRNQEEFTKEEPKTIPTIVVIEEAQSVLADRTSTAEPFISWVKEGRKYDLGALLITQQPGSIPNEILSQGGNWFIFHLLSAGDLQNVRSANAHFSTDLLGSLLNEPIPGQGIFWSSVARREYPIPVRIRSFEQLFSARDPQYNAKPPQTFGATLRERSNRLVEAARTMGATTTARREDDVEQSPEAEPIVDADAALFRIAVGAIRQRADVLADLRGPGVRWGTIQSYIARALEGMLDNAFPAVHERGLVKRVLDELYGNQGDGWASQKDTQRNRTVVVVRALRDPR